MPQRSPGIDDFQLYLLATMTDAPDPLLEDALSRLSADREMMREAYRRMHDARPATRPVFEDMPDIIGTPQTWGSRPFTGDDPFVRTGELFFQVYDLPLWRDFRFEITANSDGFIYSEHFVRPSQESIPRLRDVDDLVPWGCLRDEVDEAFGPMQAEDLWSPYEGYVLTLHKAGASRTYYATFSWGLFQKISPAE